MYDKEGLVELAQGLSDLGWELVASGNTSAKLNEAGIAHLEVAEVTARPNARRAGQDRSTRRSTAASWPTARSPSTSTILSTNGIEAIDLVASNLYPFSSTPPSS